MDFNEALQEMVCKLIDMAPRVSRTTEYKSDFAADEVDLREVIHPKKDYATLDPDFRVVPYYQVFQERLGFIPNLSIVDLLFNMGPESLIVLKESIKGDEETRGRGDEGTRFF